MSASRTLVTPYLSSTTRPKTRNVTVSEISGDRTTLVSLILFGPFLRGLLARFVALPTALGAVVSSAVQSILSCAPRHSPCVVRRLFPFLVPSLCLSLFGSPLVSSPVAGLTPRRVCRVPLFVSRRLSPVLPAALSGSCSGRSAGLCAFFPPSEGSHRLPSCAPLRKQGSHLQCLSVSGMVRRMFETTEWFFSFSEFSKVVLTMLDSAHDTGKTEHLPTSEDDDVLPGEPNEWCSPLELPYNHCVGPVLAEWLGATGATRCLMRATSPPSSRPRAAAPIDA